MRLRLSLSLGISLICCIACSTHKSNTPHRLWHQFKLQYNALYNAEEGFRSLRSEQITEDSNQYRLALPLDIYSEEYTEAYQKLITRLEQAILSHSLRHKPPKGQQRYKGQIEFNRSIYRAWLLLGQAQFYSGNLTQAEQTFAHIRWLYKGEPKVYAQALIWQCRTLVALGRSSDADILMLDLAGYQPSNKSKHYQLYNWYQAELYLSNTDYTSALPYLRHLAQKEKQTALKARLYYALALTMRYGLGDEDNSKPYLRKALSYLPNNELRGRMSLAFEQSKDLALQLPQLNSRVQDDSLVVKSISPRGNNSLTTIYPIDWLRIYEADSTQSKSPQHRSSSDEAETTVQLSVKASDISLGEWLFILSSYHFKHFTQLPLQIELLSTPEDEIYRVQVKGLRNEQERQRYLEGLRTHLPPSSLITPL